VVVILGLGLAIINLSTKFGVSSSTVYKDINDASKCRKWDYLRLRHSEVTEGHWKYHHSIENIKVFINLPS